MTVLQSEDFLGVGNIGDTILASQTIFSGVGGAPTVVAGLEGAKAGNVNPATTGSMTNTGFSQTDGYFRCVFQVPTSLPAAETGIFMAYEGDLSTGTKIADVLLQPDGRLRVRNGNTAIGTTTMALTPGTTYAMEWRINLAGNTQEFRLFTSLSQTASPAEAAITGAVPTAPTNVQFFRMGKTLSVTWTGGITFDSYKRMDSWWATPVTAGTTWDIKFAGTVGSLIPTGGGIQSYVGTPITCAAGGPHTDQKVGIYNGQATQNRSVLATTFTNSEIQQTESFYAMIADPPNGDPGQSPLAFWKAQGVGDVTSFTLVAQANSPADTVSVELWEGDNWTLPETEDNGPLATISPVPLNQYFRVDIKLSLNQTLGLNSISGEVYAAAKKNFTTNPTGTFTGQTTLGGIRNHYLCQETIAASNDKPQISFDSWRATTPSTAFLGPIPAAEQYDPPVGTTWMAYELQGDGSELLLTPAGVWSGSALQPIDLANTSVHGDGQPPGTERFSGDPGVGKIYIGYDSEGGFTSGGQQNWHMTELARLRAVSLPAPYNQRTVDTNGIYRAFYVMPSGNNGEEGIGTFGNHSDGSWTEMRQAAANYDIVNVSYDLEPNVSGNPTLRITRLLTGYYDPWLDLMAEGMVDCNTRYGTIFHLNVGNEPDAAGNSNWNDNATNLKYFRQCSRFLHFALLARGVPRNIFEVTSGTLTNPTAYGHATRFNDNGGQTSGAWVGGNPGDGIHQWNPDWKGTLTGWGNAFDPNPADFYRAGDVDEWGYGAGPIIRFWSINSYCQGPFGNVGQYMNWTDTEYRTHLVSRQSGHAGNWQRFHRALYGGNGLPMGILEFGYGIKMTGPGDTADNNVDIDETLAQSMRHVDDWVSENISYVAKWRQTFVGHAGDVAFGYKRNGQSSGTTAVIDNQDGYRKHWAAMWHHPAIIAPFRSGTYAPSASKPISPQHN